METQIQPFDWQRIFFGDLSLLFILEIAFRTAFMFLFAILAARFIGKRGMGQLTPFEFIIVIALGSATGDPMFYPNVPLLHGAVVITVIVALEKILAKLLQKSTFIEHQVESTPSLLIKNGTMIKNALESSGITKDELFMRLRMERISDIGDVKRAYLEPSGKLSVFILPKKKGKKGESTLPKSKDT